MKRIYMDYNATTPLLPEVLDAMRPYFSENFSNPASAYQSAQVARNAVEEARIKIAQILNADSSEEIYFTSCGTESNNIVIKGVAFENWDKKGKII
ncbi:MAG: aminotransferase class V-fold PLP-dependent enzyme, partial [bacterium]